MVGSDLPPNSFWNNYFFNDIKIVLMKDKLQEQIESV